DDRRLAGDELRDAAGRVVQVAGDDGLLGADHHARRLQADLRAVGAEVALRRGVRVRINVQRVVGAGLHARLAADATVAVEVHDAVRPLVERHRRADGHARRVGAVIAAQDREEAPRVGELAFLDILDPGTKRSHGYVVLGLAGERASVTADALAVVDDEPEFGQDRSFSRAIVRKRGLAGRAGTECGSPN